MAYPDHLLARGEKVMLHKHPTPKVLVVPIALFILIIGGAFALAAWVRDQNNHVIYWIVIAVVAVGLLFWFVLVPFIKWRFEHFVITTHHIFFRAGFFKRREHQIPLGRIQNMETNVSFWGRIFGYGDLTVESAADQPLSFYNVAALTKVQSLLNQLIDDDRNRGDGMGSAAPRQGSQTRPAGNRPTAQYTTDDDEGNDFPGGDNTSRR
ncbi:PH domain-containing protein [Nakamurella antarctica]|uniref:PH domain-containing protein n=1 Tax=Nakamurella antarctica TaxID=1902245 RepID=A0A3G8ZP18_9ACTN|nr:PH domain-containing protein [Nakamurella antarctica]AZI58547.1 PH domain-containing protein [Nakamurella antarctica]